MNEQQIEILRIEIAVLHVKPGDVIVLKADSEAVFALEDAEVIKAEMKRAFPDNKVCTLSNCSLTVVSVDETPLIHYETEPYTTWCSVTNSERLNTHVTNLVTCYTCRALMIKDGVITESEMPHG